MITNTVNWGITGKPVLTPWHTGDVSDKITSYREKSSTLVQNCNDVPLFMPSEIPTLPAHKNVCVYSIFEQNPWEWVGHFPPWQNQSVTLEKNVHLYWGKSTFRPFGSILRSQRPISVIHPPRVDVGHGLNCGIFGSIVFVFFGIHMQT